MASQDAMASEEVAMPDEQKGQDPWDVQFPETTELAFSERDDMGKAMYIGIQVGKVTCVFGLLYLFIVSLGLMGSAFKILGGPSAGAVFRNQEIFDNPLAGLVLGILATVMVQSSSTSTSIIITMTAAGLMEVKNAIPMIMGANIGTSVTNTIVSIGQIGNKDEYRRAFAGATVHDCFNILTVLVLLPIEAATGLLRHMAAGLVAAFGITDDQEASEKVDFLKKITKPVTSRLVQVDKKLVTKVAKEDDPDALEKLMKKSMVVNSQYKDTHFFMDTPMDDMTAGFLLLVISLVLLSTCLILLVKTLQSVFRGRAAIWMKSLLNLEFKSVPCVADYVLILFGAGITILMQSSSITTSTLTPLVGIGLIKLDKMFPFTVGANIGTTVTGIMSALASSNIATGMTVAMAHLLFNLIGTLIWFPLPFMRRIPIGMAKLNGNLAADWKPFPIVYILVVFGLLPSAFFALSLAGVAVVASVGGLLILTLLSIAAVLTLRFKRPSALPASLLADPAWLPNSLKVNPAVQEDSTTVASSADLGTNWWQGTWAWGSGWFVLMLLLMAVPNCQFVNIKYTHEDGRNHIGIGAWQTCSKDFEKEVTYASLADTARSCDSTEMATGSQEFVDTCSEAGFENEDPEDAYEDVYIEWWHAVKSKCNSQQWLDYCKAQACLGSSHQDFCQDVFDGLGTYWTFKYGTSGDVAWTEGDEASNAAGNACHPNEAICNNPGPLADSGNLAVVGLVAAFAGQFLLMAYVFMDGKRDMKKFLIGSVASFAACWLFLLCSFAVLATALGSDAECLVMHESGNGAVIATGKFGDIMEQGLSYDFIIVSWVLTMLILAILVHRVATHKVKPSAPEAAEAPQAVEEGSL